MLERAQQLRTNSTPAERRMWSMLRGKRLAGLKFRRQHVVGNFIVDFVCLPARLIIEVDGDTHGDDEAELRDAKRTQEIEGFGYRVIRFWDHYVLNLSLIHISEPTRLGMISYAVFCLKKKNKKRY